MANTILKALIELNNREKENRRKRSEDKVKQQKYNGNREELFDSIIKTLNDSNDKLNYQII